MRVSDYVEFLAPIIPPQWKYVARSAIGPWVLHDEKPTTDGSFWVSKGREKIFDLPKFVVFQKEKDGWASSLIELDKFRKTKKSRKKKTTSRYKRLEL